MNLLKLIFPPRKKRTTLDDVNEDLEQLSGNQMDGILGGKPAFGDEYEPVKGSARDITPVSDLEMTGR